MRQVQIGSMRVDLVSEIPSLAFDKTWLFANVTDAVISENRSWLDHRYIEPGTGRFILSHHSYLVRTPRWTALVDTCCGNHKKRPRVPVWNDLDQPYLENLQALSVAPEQVDFVMCTHLHVDHVGWNTRLLDGSWVPTFPNARYLMGREEYRHFEGAHNAAPRSPVNPARSRIPCCRWSRRASPSWSRPTIDCSASAMPRYASRRRRATPPATCRSISTAATITR